MIQTSCGSAPQSSGRPRPRVFVFRHANRMWLFVLSGLLACGSIPAGNTPARTSGELRSAAARDVLGRRWGVVVVLNPITCTTNAGFISALNALRTQDSIPVRIVFVGVRNDSAMHRTFRADLGLDVPSVILADSSVTQLTGVRDIRPPYAVSISGSGGGALLEGDLSQLRAWAHAVLRVGVRAVDDE